MWILQKENSADRKFIVYDRSKYVVGRLGADIVLSGDSSISRNHAIIHIKGCKLFLEDNNSKYGTYYNTGISTSLPMRSDERVLLRPGDRVRFGVLKCIWILSHQKLHTLSSTLNAQQQHTLKSHMHILGGTVEEQPSLICTHLTMAECSLTPKLLYALIKNIPVVTCEFWTEMVNAIKDGRELPQAKKYQPKASDIDLESRPERSRLFAKYIFVFLDKDMLQTYKASIEAAGGTVAELQDSYKKQVLQPGTIVIEYLATSLTQNSQLFNEVSAFLHTHGRRCIPDYEIALAIMHCNTEKWCNFNHINSESTLESEQKNMSESLLVPETEDNELSMPSMRVTESLATSSCFSSSQNLKRKHELLINAVSDDEEELLALSKRPHTTVSKCEKRPATPTPLDVETSPLYIRGKRLTNSKVITAGYKSKKELIEPLKPITEAIPPPKTNKRSRSDSRHAHINILTDDDGLDDLFNFGDCHKPVQKKGKTAAIVKNDVQFNKNQPKISQNMCQEHTKEMHDNISGYLTTNEITKLPPVSPKVIPEASGWISCCKSKNIANDANCLDESELGMKTRVLQINKDEYEESNNDAQNDTNSTGSDTATDVKRNEPMKNAKVFKKCQPVKTLKKKILVCHPYIKDSS